MERPSVYTFGLSSFISEIVSSIVFLYEILSGVRISPRMFSTSLFFRITSFFDPFTKRALDVSKKEVLCNFLSSCS